MFVCHIFTEKLNIPLNSPKEVPHKILLELSSTLKINDETATDESYKLSIHGDNDIKITAISNAGVFYGIQTLLSLLQNNKLPECDIEDSPRYPYRGMHMDVSRNFHSKEQIMKLLDVMAMYKMNKFHFHLTDDEGWRLEIPGLEELTQAST